MTLGDLVDRAAARLAQSSVHFGHGTDNPRDEAAWLVLRGLGHPFDAELSQGVTDADVNRVEALLDKRVRERIPLAYLLKEAWLDGLPFYVDERVIVPRSHIAELLKEKTLARHPARRVLDLCTGSGCLAILAARAFPAAEVEASDLSPAALAVARKNVARYRLGARIRVRQSDLFGSLQGERYQLIVSNPPYVSAAAMTALPTEYRREPRLALAGGKDGLELVARMMMQVDQHLEPGGMLVCEIGDGRPAMQRRFPRLRLSWPKPEVFVYRKPATRAGRA